MRRYLLASLLCGAILACCGPLLVRFALPVAMQRELYRAIGAALQRQPGDGPLPFGWTLLAIAAGLRLGCGFLAMLLVDWLRRRRSPWRAARIAAFWLWLVAYLAWPLFLYIVHALHWQVLVLAIGYGFAEMNVACHLGMLVLVRRPQRRAGRR